MSKEIRINWDSILMEGDFSFDNDLQDLESDEGLETAVIISLFTDRRANEDDLLPDSNNLDRRGWWGDLVSNIEDDKIGSRLWLLEREKTVENIPVRAKKYAEEALQWMVEDGIAAKVEVEAERQGEIGNDVLALKVRIYKNFGDKQSKEFELQWTAQEARG